MAKRISMSRLLLGMAGFLLSAAELNAQESKKNTLTDDEAAKGWVLLFNGNTTTGWTIEGNVGLVDGSLAIGGPVTTRARADAPLGSNYELRMEYCTQGGGPINVHVDWRRPLGSGHVSTSLARLSKNDSEWIEIVFQGQYDPQKNERSVTSKFRALGDAIFAKQVIGGGTGDRVATIGFEVPLGNKLYLRNIKLKTDPVASDWMLVYVGTSLGILVILGVAAVLLRNKRLRNGFDGQISERKSWDDYPLWVRLSLWGLPNRASVWFFFWLSMAVAVGCGIYGFWDSRFFSGLLFLLAALPYWLAIRWVDRHGRWQ